MTPSRNSALDREMKSTKNDNTWIKYDAIISSFLFFKK